MTGLTVRYKARLGQPRACSPNNGKVVAKKPATPPRDVSNSICPAARLLVLAHYVERGVLDGTCENYSTAAKALEFSQPRLAQIIDLLFLSPNIQQRLVSGDLHISDHRLRGVLRTPDWEQQGKVLRLMLQPHPAPS